MYVSGPALNNLYCEIKDYILRTQLLMASFLLIPLCCIRDPLMHTSIQSSSHWRAGATTRPKLVVDNLKCHRFSPPVCAWCELWKWLALNPWVSGRWFVTEIITNFPFLSTCKRHPTMSAHTEYCDICDWWWCVQEEACYRWHIFSPLISPQGPPKPVAVEPCSGGKAAVLTVLLCLPRVASGVPPPGQSGQ